jgi:hypothetical protein
MKSVRVCFLLLVSTMVLAQSSRAPVVNQPNGLPIAQQRHPALLPNLSQMPQGTPFAQRGARANRASQASGLNFAPAVAYGSGGQHTLSVAIADVNGDGNLCTTHPRERELRQSACRHYKSAEEDHSV